MSLRPSPRLAQACAVTIGVALGASFFTALDRLWLASLAVLAVMAAIDAVVVWRYTAPMVTRRVARAVALGVATPVVLELRGGKGLSLHVSDSPPAACVAVGLPHALKLDTDADFVEVSYRVTPQQRGVAEFGPADLLLRSPLGLWRRRVRTGLGAQVRVFPNFRAVGRYALLAAENRVGLLGVRKRPRRGAGLEFHELRDFRAGDTLKQIDWKATSRRRRAIARQYQDEQDQQLVFLLDCGRRMHARDSELTHFDHALNAVLLLSYVALRQGDAVGIMTFGGEKRSVRPRRGPLHLNVISNALFDLQTTLAASDASQALEDALGKLTRRALVVLVTNLRDEASEGLAKTVRLAQHRHVVLAASLRETALTQSLARPLTGFDDALAVAATHHYLEARAAAHAALSSRGVHVVDVEPQALALALVNRYFDLKASGTL